MKKRKSHILSKKDHAFLLEDRRDPVTGDPFREGDEIIICAGCRSAFKRESWEYMGGEHCGQKQTLRLKDLYKDSLFSIGYVLYIWFTETVSSVPDILLIAFFGFISWLFAVSAFPGTSEDFITNLIIYSALLLFLSRDALKVSLAFSYQKGIRLEYTYRNKLLRFLARFARKAHFGLAAFLIFKVSTIDLFGHYLTAYTILSFLSLIILRKTPSDYILGVQPVFYEDFINRNNQSKVQIKP